MSAGAPLPPAWRGAGFLTIANGVAPSRRADYENWHSFEHVPERLTMPGFLAGKRYVGGRGDARRYLTVYDLDTVAAVETAAYRRLLANPTLASRAMRPVMTNVERGLYRDRGHAGSGIARHLGWLRWRGAAQDDWLGQAGRDGIAGVRQGSSMPTAAHPAFPATDDEAERHIVLFGATERAALTTLLRFLPARLAGCNVIDHGVADLILAY